MRMDARVVEGFVQQSPLMLCSCTHFMTPTSTNNSSPPYRLPLFWHSLRPFLTPQDQVRWGRASKELSDLVFCCSRLASRLLREQQYRPFSPLQAVFYIPAVSLSKKCIKSLTPTQNPNEGPQARFEVEYVRGICEFSLSGSRYTLRELLNSLKAQLSDADLLQVTELLDLLEKISPEDFSRSLTTLATLGMTPTPVLDNSTAKSFFPLLLKDLVDFQEKLVSYTTYQLNQKKKLSPSSHKELLEQFEPEIFTRFILLMARDAETLSKQRAAPFLALVYQCLIEKYRIFFEYDDLLEKLRFYLIDLEGGCESLSPNILYGKLVEFNNILASWAKKVQKNGKFLQQIVLLVFSEELSMLEKRWRHRPNQSTPIDSFLKEEIKKLYAKSNALLLATKVQQLHRKDAYLKDSHYLFSIMIEYAKRYKQTISVTLQPFFRLYDPNTLSVEEFPELFMEDHDKKSKPIRTDRKLSLSLSEEPSVSEMPNSPSPVHTTLEQRTERVPFSYEATLYALFHTFASLYDRLHFFWGKETLAKNALQSSLWHLDNVHALMRRLEKCPHGSPAEWIHLSALFVSESSLAVEQLLTAYGFFHNVLKKEELKHDLLILRISLQKFLPFLTAQEVLWLNGSSQGEFLCRKLTKCSKAAPSTLPLGNAKRLLAKACVGMDAEHPSTIQLLEDLEAYTQGFFSLISTLLCYPLKVRKPCELAQRHQELFTHLREAPLSSSQPSPLPASEITASLEGITKSLTMLRHQEDIETYFSNQLTNLEFHLLRLRVELTRHSFLNPYEFALHYSTLLQSIHWIAEYTLEILLLQKGKKMTDDHDLQKMVQELEEPSLHLPEEVCTFLASGKETVYLTRYIHHAESKDHKSPMKKTVHKALQIRNKHTLPSTHLEEGFQLGDKKGKKEFDKIHKELLARLHALDLLLCALMHRPLISPT